MPLRTWPVGEAANAPFADHIQARLGADRDRLLADELEPVVLGRVMGGGDHDPARCAQDVDGEVEHGRGGEADVDHVHPAGVQPVRERGEKRVGACAHVSPHRDFSPLGKKAALGKAFPDAIGGVLVEIVRIDPTDVVGLEYLFLHRGRFSCPGCGAATRIERPSQR